MQTPILGQSYMLRSPNAADNRMINLYPEVITEGGKQPAYLTRAPGLRLLATLGNGPVRGLWQTGNYGYAVSGGTFYRIDSSWNATAVGPVAGFGPVSMADNGLQIFIAANPYGYIYDIQANTIAQILDPDFPGAVTVGFIDGYFVFNEPNSQRFWITALYEGDNIDALDFASAEGSPDGLVAVAVDHREAWLFGTNSVEVWYNSGASDFPFERIQGAYNEIGCVAAYSVAKLDNGLFWLGADARGRGIVYRANGYTGQRISTHAVEWAIQQYSNINDAIGYTYQQDGHAFYVLIFPTARTTWVYDVATDAWHERAGWENGEFVRHRSNCQMSFNGEIVVGDYNSGKIYAFDKNVYTDDGDIQKWLRSWRALPTGQNNLKRTAQHSLQIDMASGTSTVEDTPSITPDPWPPAPSQYWINVTKFIAQNTYGTSPFDFDSLGNIYYGVSFASQTSAPLDYDVGLAVKLTSGGTFVNDYQYTISSSQQPSITGAVYSNNMLYLNGKIYNPSSSTNYANVLSLSSALTSVGIQNTYNAVLTDAGIDYISVDATHQKLMSQSYRYSGNDGYLLTKLDASNNIVWNSFVGSTNFRTTSSRTAFLSDGSAIMLFNSSAVPYDLCAAKYDTSGTLVWMLSFGTSIASPRYGESFFGDIAVDASDNIYFSAGIRDTIPRQTGIFKVDANGSVLWQRKLSHANGCSPTNLSLDSNNNVYITGFEEGTFLNYIAKYDDSGALQWQRSFNLVSPTDAGVLVGSSWVRISGNNTMVVATPTYGTSLSVPNCFQYIATFNFPTDGSLTDTYTLNGLQVDYAITTDYTSSTSTWPTSSTTSSTTLITITPGTFATATNSEPTTSQTVQV